MERLRENLNDWKIENFTMHQAFWEIKERVLKRKDM
jgi:hypothetical protein